MSELDRSGSPLADRPAGFLDVAWSVLRRNLLSWLLPPIFLAGLLSILLADPPWPARTRMFPQALTACALALSILNLVIPHVGFLRRLKPTTMLDLGVEASLPAQRIRQQEVLVFGWFLALLVGVVTVGAGVTVPVFLIMYLRRKAALPWRKTLLYAGLMWAIFFVLFEPVLGIHWPTPLLRGLW